MEVNEQAQKPCLSAQQICLFSDGIIYNYAIQFVEKHKMAKVSMKQLSGLQNAVGAGDWGEISHYVDNRLNRKTTPAGVKRFYKDLKNQLNDLRAHAAEPSAYLLLKEFIQHLVAEYNYQRSLGCVRCVENTYSLEN